jgi:hypothetical protein
VDSDGTEAVMDRLEEPARTMERELEDALGEEVTSDEAHAATGDRPRGVTGVLRENRLLVAVTGAVVLVLAAMLGLVLDSVVFVLLALAVHLIATFFVASLAIRLAGDGEKPDPVTVARLQAAGVSDPEAALNAAVKAHAGMDGSVRNLRD